MAKKKEDKILSLDTILFNCRDHLRAARNSGSFFEKRDMMLTLVFLRFIGEKYEDGIEKPREEEVLSFEITSIDEDSIGIHTFQVFSDKEEGIDLMSDKQDFTVTVDKPLKLTTPTMDEGDIFTLTLSRK